MRRRAFLYGAMAMGSGSLALVTPADAKVFRIGLLGGSTPTSPESGHVWQAFFEALRGLGYVEGQNLVIDGRFYGNDVERLPTLAAELVRLPVDVIVAGASPAPEAAKRVTSAIPIVVANHYDPVGSGLVASLARPGGNVTGLSLASPELRVKQLQLLKETVPGLVRVAVLSNPTISSHSQDVTELEEPARSMALRLLVVHAPAPSAFTEAFSMMRKEKVGALIIFSGSMFFAYRARLAELATKNRLPSVHLLKEYATAGGLMTYGPNLRDSFRRAAGYVDRVLKGAKPGDLPVEQPSNFELVINLKTARTLGLTIPPSVLARADQVIE